MITKINSIKKFGIFTDFDWDTKVRASNGRVQSFQHINIIYGRNYSGKTTLSRILRAMETGEISDKFENPSFEVTLTDGQVTQDILTNHHKTIRVFNDDFVRDNLRFITNPDDNIEPFAIIGEDNIKIEKEIEDLETELGSKEEGKETGLYAQGITAKKAFDTESKKWQDARNDLENKLSQKATNKDIGIKYQSDRFGDQNYNIQKLKNDIIRIQDKDYKAPSKEEVGKYDQLIAEKTLPTISPFPAPELNFQDLMAKTETLVTKKISESDKIKELVKDAVLNRWVNEGRNYHKNKRSTCAFCANPISEDRWRALEKHFDEESEQLEKDIDVLIQTVKQEKDFVNSALSIDKSRFYSRFHDQLDSLDKTRQEAVNKYVESLASLINQLESRKKSILNQASFEEPEDASASLLDTWHLYETILVESNNFSESLNKEQENAKESLRLKEVSDYLMTIEYEKKQGLIQKLKEEQDRIEQKKLRIDDDIREKEELIMSKKRELNDEKKGAKKINEYLHNFFGHKFLTLEAKEDDAVDEESKHIYFEVIRDGKKAYHLSGGECSLLAFCYFLAKLDDIDTWDSRPIIWIDDPVSSLDGNHIFFIYSLLNTKIVSTEKFEQLFVSTHNLEFLKYLKRLGKYVEGKLRKYKEGHFIVVRQDQSSVIQVMPKYLEKYVTEFNYLFKQIYKCATIEEINDKNYTTFYNFANNARKFLEIYLYYKYPDRGMNVSTLSKFFGGGRVPAILADRINNEYSHLCGVFERGAIPVEKPEMQKVAHLIIEKLKEDQAQYSSLLKSIGVSKDKIEAGGITHDRSHT